MGRKQGLIYFLNTQCFPLCKTLITFICSLPSKHLIWCHFPKKPKCKHFKCAARQQAQNSAWHLLHYLIHTGTEIRPHEEVHNKNSHNNRLLPKALDSFLCSFFPLNNWGSALPMAGGVRTWWIHSSMVLLSWKLKADAQFFFPLFLLLSLFFVFCQREGASRRGGGGLELFL